MVMQFVSNPLSAYYRSTAFDNVLNYIGRNPRRCAIKEVKGRRLMHVDNIHSVEEALSVLKDMDNGNTKK
jgi:transcription-repair coupling factor (superfamily II helicase)